MIVVHQQLKMVYAAVESLKTLLHETFLLLLLYVFMMISDNEETKVSWECLHKA